MLLKIVTLPLSPFCRQLQKCFHKNALRPTDPFQTLVESVYNVVTARVISSNANKILPKQFLTQDMKGLLHPYQMMIQSLHTLCIYTSELVTWQNVNKSWRHFPRQNSCTIRVVCQYIHSQSIKSYSSHVT